MITTRTPLRISFFGGGTDYPIWCTVSLAVPYYSIVIDKCCYITCRRLPPFFEYHSRVSYSRIPKYARSERCVRAPIRPGPA